MYIYTFDYLSEEVIEELTKLNVQVTELVDTHGHAATFYCDIEAEKVLTQLNLQPLDSWCEE